MTKWLIKLLVLQKLYLITNAFWFVDVSDEHFEFVIIQLLLCHFLLKDIYCIQ